MREFTASYPDVSLSLSMKMCTQRKAGRRSFAVHHQSLPFRARLYDEKNEAPEEEAVPNMRTAEIGPDLRL